MTEIALNYLGNFEVLKDGKPLSLPPSRKTRALLAFLSLNPKRYRRDYLCELLWEIPDDPRGSLRWSLSKLRRLIDEPGRPRIVADRTFVEIDPADAAIDVTRLRTLVAERLATASTEELEEAATEFTGNFLEGLDLPNFHDFHAWCIAERDQVARDQAALLEALVARHQEDPAKALPYARRLVGISPYDEETRAALIRLLVRLNHTDEAEQQYQLGLRMLKEVGVVPAGSIHAARRRPQPRPEAESAAVAPPEPDVASIEQGSGLVGRDTEAAALAALFAEVRDKGKARFALIRGEPGIGKTRLVETLTALARGSDATVMTSSAYESESIRPFALWVDALRSFSPESSSEIFGDREANNRDRLFDRLSEFVSQQSGSQPLVLVFDDMHWCDDSSAAAIHYVARMNRDRPVFGLLTTREMELRDNVPAQQAIAGLRKDGILTEIELGPLDETALVALINDRAPGVHAEELSRRCGGNPLLAIELARAERAGDNSTSLGELVRERLARLAVEGMEVVQWAAVLHPYIGIKALEELTDFEPVRIGEYLEAAVRQGILTGAGARLGFTHNLLQQAVYTTLSPLRRQVMHRKVALWMEQGMAVDPERAADLAHHAAQSGDAGLAARAMVSAGRLALRFYAYDDALNLVRRGMQLVGELPEAERVCVSIDLHDIRLAASPLEDWDASAREYARLAEQALGFGELAHARLGYHMAASVRWEHGQWADAREESLQSERVVRSGTDEDQIVGMAETAKCLVLIERDLPKADALVMEAAALAARKGFRHFAVPAGLGMLRFHENRLEEAAELLMESRALSKSAGARFDEFLANEYLFMIEFQRGEFEQARRYTVALCEIGDKLRVGSEGPCAHALAALVDYALTGNDDSLDPALEDLRVADAKHRLAYTLSRAAQLDCEHRQFDRAQARAEEALEYATLLNRASEMMLARAILACIAGEKGDTESVAEHEAAITSLKVAGVSAWASTFYEERKLAHGVA